jgi:glucosamine-6-phosphate deaminase
LLGFLLLFAAVFVAHGRSRFFLARGLGKPIQRATILDFAALAEKRLFHEFTANSRREGNGGLDREGALDYNRVRGKTADRTTLARGATDPMRVIVERDKDGVSRRAAQLVASLVRRRPTCVLGLATGGTPLGMYAELIRMHRDEGLDFSRVVTFNLDEYVGLSGSHPHSYRHFMQQNLFDHVNIDPRDTHVPDGRALDFEAYCEQYERLISEEGGIDLQVLGIGGDGHIAFNEPGSSLGSRTRLKTLTEETVRDNARFFGSEKDVPRLAITMGVGTILESRQCLLLAAGDGKARAIRDTIKGPITAQVTASALQLHRDVIAILDEEAARLLERRDYYREVERAQAALQNGQLGRPSEPA